jgi:hypothetical protein
MKIKYTDAAAPAKRNTTEHVSATLAAALVAGGFAEVVPLPPRGSKEWLAERLEQSARAGAPDTSDVDPNAMQKAIDAAERGERTHPFANNY